MSTSEQILLPDIGDFDSVDVIEVLVEAGDVIEKETPLITLESDKATMDLPAPFAGTVTEMAVNVGDKIAQGSLIAVIQTNSSKTTPDRLITTEIHTNQKCQNSMICFQQSPITVFAWMMFQSLLPVN